MFSWGGGGLGERVEILGRDNYVCDWAIIVFHNAFDIRFSEVKWI